MKNANKRDLIEAIDKNTEELHQKIDMYRYLMAAILDKYEDDEDVLVDEAIIIIDGLDVLPLYLNTGKLFVPFGYFESHFINDPLILELGETRESTVVAGFANDMFNLSLGAFNGDVKETDEDDKHIDNFVSRAVFTLPEGSVSGLGLMAGASYIFNITDSNGLQDYLGEEHGIDEIKDYIPGWNIFLNASFRDIFFLEAEYTASSGGFEKVDLGLAPGESFEPRAWNFELAWVFSEDLEIAARYGAATMP